ncbi:glycosyltransferase family 4 protein [Metapseudomonas otitidis]|uniref:glycosyltransferase family 4 protein n=1 Tax=Metapseudomonas otitidis TaxID=319939 RepID=UPI003A88A021
MLAARRKVLFVTSFHPGASGYIGAGEAISAETLQRLRGEGAQVDVLAIAPRYQRKNAAADSWCNSYTEVPASRWTALAGLFHHVFSGAVLAPWFFTRTSPRAIATLKTAIERFQPTELWIDFPSSLGFACHVETLPIHYFVHDVVSQKIIRSPLKRLLLPWVRKVETSLLRKVECCYLLSEKDEQLLRQLQFGERTEVWGAQGLNVGRVDGACSVSSILAQFGPGPNLVFFGNMGRPENSHSIIHFALFKWRRIRLVFPDAQLWVIGLAPGWLLRVLGRLVPGLKVTGAVDDPTPAFQAATLCIAPLLFGAGVKIKVLQMLEAGATVISTPVGAEGIKPTSRLVVVDDSEISERLVTDLQALNHMSPKPFQQVD